ncbi:MAG: MFS transporter [Clostridia bacterium]|nr:MFS transporter [Clostridia bacterium]
MKLTYKHTFVSCLAGAVTQAITNNLPPLLFVIFTKDLGVSLTELSLLITVNFFIQIGVDVLGALFVDKIGYRACMLLANASASLGLILLGILPRAMASSTAGIFISVIISAFGAGLLEVVGSPMTLALPGDKKSGTLAFVHSSYCWGHAAVIAFTIVFFAIAPEGLWWLLPLIWATVPLLSLVSFFFVPILELEKEGKNEPISSLVSIRMFWVFTIIMLASGAAELAVAQWASYFAEVGLGVSKALGDALGPLSFAIFMGTGRILFALFGTKFKIKNTLLLSFALCVASYGIISLSQNPFISLIGCALCGLSVAVMWPGTYTYGAEKIPTGGTAMFALFALAGDVGCALGPDVVGIVSDLITSGKLDFLLKIVPASDGLSGMRAGILLAAIFPIIGLFTLVALRFSTNKRKENSDL